jgi:hypothetical protein
MKVDFTKEGPPPAHVRLHHRLLAMPYPDAGLPLGLLVDILRMNQAFRDVSPVMKIRARAVEIYRPDVALDASDA